MMDLTKYFSDSLKKELEKHQKLVKRSRKKEKPPKNASFLTLKNLRWWLYINTNYTIPENKRAFFLPCAGAHKTRNKTRIRINDCGEQVEYTDPRKYISESTSHNFLKAIRDDTDNEKIILSEPLVIIPYTQEQNPIRPDYNLPVSFLSLQGEFTFIDRLSQFLLKLKFMQPNRKRIFYCGGAHHYFILHFANQLSANNQTGEAPFEIVYRIPPNGIRDYAKTSKEFMRDIKKWEMTGFPTITPYPIEEELNKRTGRYTHKPFLLALIQAQRLGRSKTKISKTKIGLADALAFQKGFSEIYTQISQAISQV